MKTVICYPEPTTSITVSTWIIASYLEKQGYDVYYNEVLAGHDIDLESYFDQLALYCLEDCLTPQTIKRLVLSRHIVHSYSTDRTVIDNLKDVFAYPIPDNCKHRLDFVCKEAAYLPELVWQEFYKDESPIVLGKELNYANFNQLISNL